MARKEQTGSGATRRGHAGVVKSSAPRGRKRRAARTSVKSRASSTPSQAPRATATAGEHPAAGSVWSGAGAAGRPTPLLTLAVVAPLADAPLALAGAQQGTLRDALQSWGAARDEAANRLWRRPGGLARMAGL